MTITTEKKIITEIKCTISEFNAYTTAKKWIPTTNVKFFKQTEGYVMCNCKTNYGVSLIKIIILQYFKK
jgi:hypothetical protein